MKLKIVIASLCSVFVLSACITTQRTVQEVTDLNIKDFEKECSKSYEENFVNKKGGEIAGLREMYQKAYKKAKDPKVDINERLKKSEAAFKLCLVVRRMNNE